jgi:class 3 adenylate cyclase
MRIYPVSVVPLLISTVFFQGIGGSFGGAVFSWTVAPVLVTPVLMSFFLLRIWAASVVTFLQLGMIALLNLGVTGWSLAPVIPSGWVTVITTCTAVLPIAVVAGWMAARGQELAESEGHARREVAALNADLEGRVTAQVTEIEGLNRLRRFLAPEVADKVMDGPSISAPHRARIGVFFSDLRGFTAFTQRAEPEDVMEVLRDYYEVVGRALQSAGGTIGGFEGDGIIAYFGDPLPHDDPALAAAQVAAELRTPLDALTAKWRRHGHSLGWGIGIAYGYATLGVVGFDGRHDYTPIGSVVNLAARLCARAGASEVLLDQAAVTSIGGRLATSHVADHDLKGFADPVATYALI